MGGEGQAGAELREHAIEWLVALDCGTADTKAFEAWRSASPRHASAFAQVAATWRRTAAPQIAVLIGQPAEAEAEPTAEPHPESARWMSRRAVAAGLVAALGVGGAGTFLAWPSRAYASTEVGERRTIPLPDGSHAMLNTDTRVSWRFGKGREFWIERGEVALLVRQSETPFHLRSDPLEAQIGGGSVNIRLDGADARLLVLAGQAEASSRDIAAKTIAAGHMLVVDREGAAEVSALPADAIGAATAWQERRIVFKGMRLDQGVAEFNRYLPDRIVLENADLGATRLGGAFRIDDPDSFLLALQDGFDIAHRREGNHILLYRAGPKGTAGRDDAVRS